VGSEADWKAGVSRFASLVLSAMLLGLTGCNSSKMSLPLGELSSAKHETWSADGIEKREVSMTVDMVERLNSIKLCGTGATTVTEFLKLEYQNGDSAGFGIANFGSKEEPIYAIAYQFPGDDGADLRHPCSEGQHREFVEIIQILIPEGL